MHEDGEQYKYAQRPGEFRRGEVVDRLAGKTSKEQVNYRPGETADAKSSCGECEHFLTPGQPNSGCRRVAGVVEAIGLCDLFAPRASEYGDQGESTVPES